MNQEAPFLEIPLVTLVSNNAYLIVEHAKDFSCVRLMNEEGHEDEFRFGIIKSPGEQADHKLFPIESFGTVVLFAMDGTERRVKIVDRENLIDNSVLAHEEAPFIYLDQDLKEINFLALVSHPEKWTLNIVNGVYELQNTGNANGSETPRLFRKRVRLEHGHPEEITFSVRTTNTGKDKKVIVNTKDGSVGGGDTKD